MIEFYCTRFYHIKCFMVVVSWIFNLQSVYPLLAICINLHLGFYCSMATLWNGFQNTLIRTNQFITFDSVWDSFSKCYVLSNYTGFWTSQWKKSRECLCPSVRPISNSCNFIKLFLLILCRSYHHISCRAPSINRIFRYSDEDTQYQYLQFQPFVCDIFTQQLQIAPFLWWVTLSGLLLDRLVFVSSFEWHFGLSLNL